MCHCVCVCTSVCVIVCVRVCALERVCHCPCISQKTSCRSQFFLSCGFRDYSLGHEPCPHVPLPTEPPYEFTNNTKLQMSISVLRVYSSLLPSSFPPSLSPCFPSLLIGIFVTVSRYCSHAVLKLINFLL